jgi:hypothetical protein
MKVKTTILTVIAFTTLAHAALPAPIPYPKGVWSGFDVAGAGAALRLY